MERVDFQRSHGAPVVITSALCSPFLSFFLDYSLIFLAFPLSFLAFSRALTFVLALT